MERVGGDGGDVPAVVVESRGRDDDAGEVTEPVRELVVGISTVAFFGADAVRGALTGNTFLTLGGLGFLVFVLASEVTATRHPATPRAERVAVSVLTFLESRRARRVVLVLLGLLAFSTAVRGITSTVDGDWGAVVFDVVHLAGIAGVSLGIGTRTYQGS
jgi:hypothetical protein